MQFGMPVLLEKKTLESCAALCRDLGLAFIELNMNLPQYQIGSIDVNELLAVARKYDIYFTIHLDENLNVCDFNSRVADAYLETALQTIELAKRLDVPVINMHMPFGVYFTLPQGRVYLFDEHPEHYLNHLKTFRDECEKRITGSDIKICIENTGGYGAAFLQKGLNLLLDSDAFALTFDIGHNWSIGGRDEAVILQHSEKLLHMHAHDAVGGKNHLALGMGEIDVAKYLRLADEHGCRVVLETKTADGLTQSAAYVGAFEHINDTDRALYLAKAHGRNRVEFAQETQGDAAQPTVAKNV